jgi:hypothetical protein
MSILKRFNQIFGLGDDVEVERRRFVERVNQTIFHEIDTTGTAQFHYDSLFYSVCFELGVNAHDFRRRLYDPAEIRTLTGDVFEKTLLVLCALYVYIELRPNTKGQKWLSEGIEFVLSRCACDIGVRWKDGSFYPAGAEELDKPLVEETLTWLSDYPDERKDYQRALQCYLAGEALGDVIKNCYSAVEGVARKVLGNERTLDKNKDELLAKLNLSDGWKSLLANYIKYAHDYRHASVGRHEIKKQEAEAYFYMTGLIIRLTIESK